MIDGVVLGVLNNYFRAATEAMGYVLERTAFTTYVKETKDFGTGLLTPEGEHFAFPAEVGAQNYLGIDYSTFINAIESWNYGDIAISNCPYSTAGVATHLPDIHVLKPIYFEGNIIAFAWAFIHSTDVGGVVPGSILPSADEIYQEGVRVRPVKLYEAGQLNDQVLDLLLDNARIPDKNRGDISALVSAVNTGEARCLAAVGKWGADIVLAARYELIAHAEAKAFELLETIPEGDFEFHDYLEDIVVSPFPARIKLSLRRDRDGLLFDFTGTSPQVAAAFNLVSSGRHPFLCGSLFDYMRTLDPDLPCNGGLMRPVRMKAPEGSIVNATFPAACGVRYAITQLAYVILQGALAQAVTYSTPAAGAGQATIVAVGISDGKGGRIVNVVQPMIGGSGAQHGADGVDGCDFSLRELANTPTERLEQEVPILVKQYETIQDSGGPGEFRGGLGLRLDFKVFSSNTIVTGRGMERFKFQPWGLHGGWAGANGGSVVNPGSAGSIDSGKIDLLRLSRHDVYSIRTPGGGGFGNPLFRPLDKVESDVRLGFVSEVQARDMYGVEFDRNGAAIPTDARKDHGRTASSPDDSIFIRGEACDLFETQYDSSVRDMIYNRLFEIPHALRVDALKMLGESVDADPSVASDVSRISSILSLFKS